VQASWLVSVFQIAGLALGVFGGLLADRFGPRRTMSAGLALLNGARAWALIDGRNHVEPEDVQAVLPSVAGHRLHGQAAGGAIPGHELAERLLAEVAVP